MGNGWSGAGQHDSVARSQAAGAAMVAEATRQNGHAPIDKRAVVYLPRATSLANRRPLGILSAFGLAGHPVFIVDPVTAPSTGNLNIVDSIRKTPHSDVIVYANAGTNNEAIEAYERPFILFDLIDDPDEPVLARKGKPIDQGLLRKADLVMASSTEMAGRYRSFRSDLHLVPDGIQLKRLQTASSLPRPRDLPPVGKPLIGYLGPVTPSFHFALLEIVARRRPAWNFVIVGSLAGGVERSVARLATLPNVAFLGARGDDVVDVYLHSFDVGAFWLIVNEDTTRMRPMRMYEYLAIGTPCVATPIRACAAESSVATAAEPEGFIQAIDQALRTVSAEVMSSRVATGRQVDWSRQLAPVLRVLDSQHTLS